ncbi:MAG: toll/interleukin-1 receptor domain-containing protein [Acidobacteriota bacterium]|nr:toll/interleukin-1 receptor domain-containing protein [Acidobacteriota bacterium]
MARIFISHSTHDDLTRVVRLRLIERLRTLGLEPLVDYEIQPGEPWRAKLDFWLDCCDGAVLLFSRSALESDWVRKEATILTWRKSRDPRLRLVPVLLGDVSPEDLSRGYLSSLQVGEIEWAKMDSGSNEEQDVEPLIEKIAQSFGGLPRGDGDPDLRAWISRTAGCLRKADPGDLELAAVQLGIGEPDWRDFCELAVTVAHHLLHQELEHSLPGLAHVMAALPRGGRETLCELLEPLWVREEAARHILPVTRRASAQRLLAINARFQETGDCYIYRATCCSPGSRTLRTSGVFGEDQVGEILAAFEEGCRRAFGSGMGPEIPADMWEKILQSQLRKQPGPVFLLLTEHQVERQVVEALRQRFPTATLVLLTGPSLPDGNALGLEGLELIRPPLGEEEEVEGVATVGIVRSLAAKNRTFGDSRS